MQLLLRYYDVSTRNPKSRVDIVVDNNTRNAKWKKEGRQVSRWFAARLRCQMDFQWPDWIHDITKIKITKQFLHIYWYSPKFIVLMHRVTQVAHNLTKS